jgi:hypothetical protein
MQLGARRALAVAHMGGGFAAFDGQLAKRVVGGRPELGQPFGKVCAVPEGLRAARQTAVAKQVDRLDHNDDPRRQRHAEQQQRDASGDPVALEPDIDEAEFAFHDLITPAQN